MKTKLLLQAASLSVFCVCTSSFADYYVSGSFGQSEFETSLFEEDNNIKLSLGYEFSENLALEGSYVNMGEFGANARFLDEINDELDFIFPGATVNSASTEITGYELSIVGTLPLNDAVSLYGRAGVFGWNLDLDVDVTVPGFGSSSGSEGESGTDMAIAAGIEYQANNSLSIFGEYGQYSVDSSDIKELSVGLKIKF